MKRYADEHRNMNSEYEAIENEFEILYTELDEINLHVRSGSALPLQEPDVVTKRSRVKPFGLLYALPTEGALDNANKDDIFVGSMFWDDGDQIELKNFAKVNFFGSKVKFFNIDIATRKKQY